MVEVLEHHVGQADAFTMSLERDPLLRSTIVAVALLDRAPDLEILRDRLDRATRLAPTFRERLVPSPLGLAPPRFQVDPDFDLGFHLRRVQAPAPQDLATVLEMARTMGMAAFDPARPLWEFTVVEGLHDGHAALIMKVHHALTDGIGGIQLAAHVVDFSREPTEQGPMPPAPRGRQHGPGEPLVDALRYDLRAAANLALGVVKAAPRGVEQTLRDPLGVMRRSAATATALARFVRPVTETRSTVMRDRRLRWHLATLEVDLAALRAAGHAADGTLNDAFIAGLTGGLARYHASHDAPVEALRLTMPISVRRPEDPEGGNHITLVRFEVPLDQPDPIERMRDLDRRCAALRVDPALPYTEAVAGVLNLLPSAITAGMLRHVDFVASNVPGFPLPVYVGGAELLGFFPFGPPLGSAANCTLMSYRDTCCIGINTDAGAVVDLDRFLDCLVEGFEEVLAVAGDHPPVRRGATDRGEQGARERGAR